jgi:alpha-beta hydrolase superfamily lysophospholipase
VRKLWIGSLAVILICLGASAIVGRAIGPNILRPARVPLDVARLAWIDQMLVRTHATREDFLVRAPDGAQLRGWKVRAATPNGNWVLLFHGVADDRTGMGAFAEFLLRAGYNVVMMDSRAQGESGGNLATYGWEERNDTVAIVTALESSESARHIFALGVSMGAAIALQSAAADPRIKAVVAEDPLANLREVSYDYAGLHWSPWLGKTLFRPATIEALRAIADAGRFDPDQVSPENAVQVRQFPVLLICGTADHTIPCRHAQMIYNAARGPKELWIVPNAGHASAYGEDPDEYERRTLAFFSKYGS